MRRNASVRISIQGEWNEARSGSLEADRRKCRIFSISDDGVVKGIMEPAGNDSGVAATAEATLEDGQKVTAEVKLYGESDGYVERLLSEFEAKYITGAMTEREKMEKAAWYIGATTSYEYNQADWRLLLFAGGGDCYASRVLLARMCKHMGIKAEECRNYDYHGRTLVKADGTIILLSPVSMNQSRGAT